MTQPDSELILRNVLVTGASGFIGAHLACRLASMGVAVRGLLRNTSRPVIPLQGVSEVHGDITDVESLKHAVKGVDTVFHSAGMLGPAHAPMEAYRAVNALGTENLIRVCRDQGIQRFVHISSVGVLGPIPPRTNACEGTPPRPQDRYEITKLEGEEIALTAAKEGFPAVIARPAWVYGPGDRRTLKLFRMIARRRFMIIGKADNKQHPVWIQDLVDGLLRCAQVPGIEGRVYHLAGPEILTVEKLCSTIAEAAGVTISPLRPPVALIRTPALLLEKLFSLWGGDPPVDHRKVDFFLVNRAYSIKRAKAELAWNPKMKFAPGVVQTIAWYREKGMV